MNKITFTWDENKNKINQTKHNISFEEAQTTFFDENAFKYFDPDHSRNEDRFLLLGLSAHLRILVVNYSYLQEDSIIRIISARKATKNEQKNYTWRK